MDRRLDIIGPSGTYTLTNDWLWPHGLVDLGGWWDTPGLRREAAERLGDGVFLGPSHLGAREITVKGSERCALGDEDATRDEVVRLCRAATTLRETVGDRVLSAGVRLDGAVTFRIMDRRIDWQAPFIASDPHLYGRERQATMTPAGTGAGLMYPLTYPLSYGTDLGSPNATLTNDGNAPAWPTFTVTGDFPSGFRISMSGRVIEYPYATFWATPVTVDMRGHLMVGGVDQQAMLTRREWASIPAEGVAVATFEPIQSGGTGACVATVRDTYL